jgi:DNA-binding response OmpR family regulator
MKQHLLIVDDEENIRELLKACLTSSGYRATAAASAAEALRVARDEPPDLIISDLQLEDADGLEMISELKAVLPNTPVILLTGVFFDPKVVSEILRAKIDCYLEKTSPLAKILEAVRRLIGPPSAL